MPIVDFIRAVAALAVTLGLIGLAAYALRRFGPDAVGRMITARQVRRMRVVESLALDPTRRLVIFSLDGEERLMLLGEGKLLDWGPKVVAVLPLLVFSRFRSGARGLMRSLIKSLTGAKPEDLRRAAVISMLAAFATVVMPAVALASAVNNRTWAPARA
jgi:flagellar protein FliO/FliZ